MITIPGRIPIRIFPLFFLLVIGISSINSIYMVGTFSLLWTIIWSLVIMVSVTIHEFGHALTAVAFGQKARIDLVGFGGITQRQGGRLKLWQDFIVVLNGPLAGLSISGIAYILLNIIGNKPASLLTSVISIFYYANIFWTIINLLPVQPLDGGHLLRIFLEGIFGLKGVKISLFISFIIAVLISLLFLLLGYYLAGAFFLMFTFESYRSWKNSLALTEQDQNFDLQHLLKSAERDYHKGHSDFAIQKIQQVRELTKAGVLYVTATQLMAEILNDQNQFQEAYNMLEPIKNKLSDKALKMLQRLAYRTEKWQEAIAIGNTAYKSQPSPEIALINAFCHGILGEAKPAVGWLQCAVREGLPNLKDILRKSDFDPIRQDPLFQNLTEMH